MRDPFEPMAAAAIAAAVHRGWGLDLDELRYLPEGGGAYHWIGRTEEGPRWFVTCDDLDTKPWLGADRETTFAALVGAYRAAMDLRAAGAAFVVAATATGSGEPAVRLDDRHALSVCEWVDGEPGRWGRAISPTGRRGVVSMLARLHERTSAVRTSARRGLEVPGRADLEQALDELDDRWDGGPLSEAARRELSAHRDVVVTGLAQLDRFAARSADGGDRDVVTHGEPHPGNLIYTGRGPVLVDWDTVALARPERDLWMVADATDAGRDAADLYRELTGVALDPEALTAQRLLWALGDVAAFTRQLRGPHRRTADAERALTGLRDVLSGREPAPYGSPPRVRTSRAGRVRRGARRRRGRRRPP